MFFIFVLQVVCSDAHDMQLNWTQTSMPVYRIANGTTFSNDTEFSADFCCEPGAERYIVPVIFCIVVLVGCVGNTLVIVVLLRKRKYLRVSTNVMMMNLAIADMLFLIFCVPFHAIIYTTPQWPFGEFMCRFVHFMQFVSMFGSVFTLVAMTAERFSVVKFPIRSKLFRSKSASFGICVGIWLSSACIALPPPIFYTIKRYTNHGLSAIDICADDWGSNKASRPIFFLIVFILGYALPLTLIFFFNMMTIFILWSSKELTRTNMSESVRKKQKVTRLVVMLVVVFGLSWLPYHINLMWVNYFSDTYMNTYSFYYFSVVGLVMSYANSSINPIIYAFLSENFRRSLCYSVKFEFNRIIPTEQYTMTLIRRTASQKSTSLE